MANDFQVKLRRQVSDGRWMAGERLPSIRAMAALAGVRPHVVAGAYGQLVAEGLLDAQPGRGYFMAQPSSGNGMAALTDPDELSPNPLFRLLQAGPDACKLGCGWLPLAWRDTEVLARAVRRTARLSQRGLVEYGDIQGHLPLRRQLAVHLRRSTRIEVGPDQFLTTLGATQALDLVARLLLEPGEPVLVDEPCSANLIQLIRLQGGVPLGVPRRADGPDLAVLDQWLASHRVRAFFCNSTWHNPTGAGISPQAAFQVMKRAQAHDFVVVEDDVHGDFHPGIRPTFAELDDLAHAIYIGSFSKSLSSSLRIGYLVASAGRLARLAELKLLTSVAVPGFCERFVHTILADGTYQAHLRDIQRRLTRQQVSAQRALRAQGWQFEVAPEGGMFLWIHHPDMPDLSPLIERLAVQGVLLMPGDAFAVSRPCRQYTRINVAHLSRPQVRLLDANILIRHSWS